MSGYVMVPGWLIERQPTGNALLAYVHLAKRGTWNPGSGTYDECRPSMKTLGIDMKGSEDKARRGVQELIKLGAVKRRQRFDANGGELPAMYQVIFGTLVGPPPTQQEGVADLRRGGSQKRDGGGSKSATTPVANLRHNQEPLNQEPNTNQELLVRDAAAAASAPGSGTACRPVKARPDVEKLCEHLADLIERNGSNRPTITARWRSAARLMLDADKREFSKAVALIDWCQSHEFWRANILSMPTFREKYEQLRLKAVAEWEQQKRCVAGNAGRGTLVEAHGMKLTPKTAEMFDLIEELRSEEAQRVLAAIPSPAPAPEWMRELEGAR